MICERTDTMATNLKDKLDMPATLEDVLDEVSRIRTTVTEAVDDGFKTAMRAIKQGRGAAEDAIDDARRAVRKNPVQAVGVVFVAGLLTGFLAGWLTTRD